MSQKSKITRQQLFNYLNKKTLNRELDKKELDHIYQVKVSNSTSLRLNNTGLQILKQFFKIYPIPFAHDFKLKSMHIFYLDKELLYPYYASNAKLVLFDKRDAFEFKLSSGDMDIWAKSRYVSDHEKMPKEW